MPVRIQRKRTKGWRMPENAVYVGRGSAFGNPYVVGKDGTAEECIQKYVNFLFPYRHHGENSSLSQLFVSIGNIEWIQAALHGQDLACWCPLDKPCHADLLLEVANNWPAPDPRYETVGGVTTFNPRGVDGNEWRQHYTRVVDAGTRWLEG